MCLEKLYNDILKIILCKMNINDARSLKLTSKKFNKFVNDNCCLIPSKNYIKEIDLNFTTLNIDKKFSNDVIKIKYCGYCGWNEIIKDIKTCNKLSTVIKFPQTNILGPVGEVGPAGIQGIRGLTGPVGDVGPTGNKGPVDLIGNKCPVQCEECKQEFCKSLIKTEYGTYKKYCINCIK